MKYVIVGLGNPGEDYAQTRHNTGFMVLDAFRSSSKFSDWHEDGKINAIVSKGKIENNDVTLVLPQTYMNKSGNSVKKVVTSKKAAERLVVVYDELDIPLGSLKISFSRSSGGHNGVESIIKALGTKDFIRMRVGVSPATSKGKAKKPKGEKAVLDFLMKDFRKPELEMLKTIFKKITTPALETIVEKGRVAAMNAFN